jgi:O-antigen ligase
MLSEAAAPAAVEWRPRMERSLVWLVLVLTLCVSPALGHITTYALLGLAPPIALFLFTRGDVRWVPSPMAWVFIAGYIALLVVFAITVNDTIDVLAAAKFIALVLFWPLSILLGRAAAPGNARRVGELALVGTVIALAYAAVTIFFSPLPRAGDVVGNDPIRLANTTAILGFMSAVLLAPHASGSKRWLYGIAGPLLAFAVVMLTGTRIAMIAFPVVGFVAIMLVIRRKWLGLAIGAGAVGVLVLLAMTNVSGNWRVALLLDTIIDLLSGRSVAGDPAAEIRLILWRAGWAVLQSSPLVGVGWGNMMESVTALTPPGAFPAGYFSHLHNEALTFAVSAGSIGIAVYLLLLGAPLMIALRSAHDTQYTARLHGVVVILVAYAVMGLTDTMLSFELHIALYVGLTAILLSYCRDPATTAA